jgi:Flp pilus assembly protein TadD
MLSTTDDDAQLDELRAQAESAMRQSRGRLEVQSVLERMLRMAANGSEHAAFAHRHMAELQVQKNPWQSALHLRKALAWGYEDDAAHALMGLCHALLGNFRAAVASYQRALRDNPSNPWYHHNVGHLLDVALHQPEQAYEHLSRAHQSEPLDDEIAASLVRCLVSLDRRDEARVLASQLVQRNPDHQDYAALLAWVSSSDPDGATLPTELSSPHIPRKNSKKRTRRPKERAVGKKTDHGN